MIVCRVGHDRFVPYPFQFIIHLSPYQWTLHNVATENVVEKPQQLYIYSQRTNQEEREDCDLKQIFKS
jgi:hypothetical protein